MERRIEAVEEKMAHVLRGLDDLSDVVAAQANEIDRLKRQVGLLLGREAGREADSGAVVLADQKPPHW